mmetsp:Transcript_29652/g.96933  ORF Transcript_29652/g.96933 Transcript_29652/m.96933 type:complete len:514 (-) Transcript_29652:1232-2773(-)
MSVATSPHPLPHVRANGARQRAHLERRGAGRVQRARRGHQLHAARHLRPVRGRDGGPRRRRRLSQPVRGVLRRSPRGAVGTRAAPTAHPGAAGGREELSPARLPACAHARPVALPGHAGGRLAHGVQRQGAGDDGRRGAAVGGGRRARPAPHVRHASGHIASRPARLSVPSGGCGGSSGRGRGSSDAASLATNARWHGCGHGCGRGRRHGCRHGCRHGRGRGPQPPLLPAPVPRHANRWATLLPRPPSAARRSHSCDAKRHCREWRSRPLVRLPAQRQPRACHGGVGEPTLRPRSCTGAGAGAGAGTGARLRPDAGAGTSSAHAGASARAGASRPPCRRHRLHDWRQFRSGGELWRPLEHATPAWRSTCPRPQPWLWRDGARPRWRGHGRGCGRGRTAVGRAGRGCHDRRRLPRFTRTPEHRQCTAWWRKPGLLTRRAHGTLPCLRLPLALPAFAMSSFAAVTSLAVAASVALPNCAWCAVSLAGACARLHSPPRPPSLARGCLVCECACVKD